MNKIKQYQEACIDLIEQFYNKYYNDENLPIDTYDYYIVWDVDKYWIDTVMIADDYRSLTDIYIALLHNISEDTLSSYSSDKLDYYMDDKEGGFPNLYNYNLRYCIQK